MRGNMHINQALVQVLYLRANGTAPTLQLGLNLARECGIIGL
jgi:hypothetical protein